MRFLSDKIALMMIDEITTLLDRYSPNGNYESDYECAFCNARNDMNVGFTIHKVNCNGRLMLQALQNCDDLLYATIGVKEKEDV